MVVLVATWKRFDVAQSAKLSHKLATSGAKFRDLPSSVAKIPNEVVPQYEVLVFIVIEKIIIFNRQFSFFKIEV